MKSVLFTIAQEGSYNTTDEALKLEGLLSTGLERYYDRKFLENYMANIRKEPGELSFNWYPQNVPGHWMSANIMTSSKIIADPVSIEVLERELAEGDYSHIVMSVYLSGYSTFRKLTKYLRQHHPEVKIIATSVGALLPESRLLADYNIKGEMVHELREILGETISKPLKPVAVRSDTEASFGGVNKRSSYALLVSSLGCMYGCDFCPSTAQFGTAYITPFTAQEIKQAIIEAHDAISPDSASFTVSLAEPQGMGNTNLWKRIFRLCDDLPFECDIVATTSSKIMEKYDPEELTRGPLRLSTVNIGVESLVRGYKKNCNVDLERLNMSLQNAGINVVSTFIVGLDWHTKENVREEVRLLKNLNSTGYIVANLEMQPGTPVYERYRKVGRLLDVPPELLNFYGYNAFTHPHFMPGFNDMLPLLDGINAEIGGGERSLTRNMEVFLNRKHASRSQKSAIRSLKENDAVKFYFSEVIRQIDLFHPFILSTN